MIYWRTTSKGPQLPSWLEGADGVKVWGGSGSERTVTVGAKPWHQPPPEEVEWRDCGEDWQAVVWGQWSVAGLRRSHVRCDVVPVTDGEGREWLAPLVLCPFPLDHVAFDVPLGRDWKPDPTPEQDRLISIARWAKSEIIKGIEKAWPDDSEDYWHDVEISLDHERAAMATADLLCTVLHVNDGTLQACRLIDKALMLGTLQAAAGMPQQAIEQVKNGTEE